MSRASALRELSRFDIRKSYPFFKDGHRDWERFSLRIRPEGFEVILLDVEAAEAGRSDLGNLIDAIAELSKMEAPKIRRRKRTRK